MMEFLKIRFSQAVKQNYWIKYNVFGISDSNYKLSPFHV